MNFFYVFLGGGLGSIIRYSISLLISKYDTSFPWATLVANALACIVLGALVQYAGRHGLSEPFKLMLMVGFCGGFSTFSTFSNETFNLFEQGNILYAFANIVASVALCLFCIFIGMKLVR